MVIIVHILNKFVFTLYIRLNDELEPNCLDFFQLPQRLDVRQLNKALISKVRVLLRTNIEEIYVSSFFCYNHDRMNWGKGNADDLAFEDEHSVK